MKSIRLIIAIFIVVVSLDVKAQQDTIRETELITLELLLEYSTECYNDSSIITTHECPENRIGCVVYHTGYRKIHRTPTLNGFIEWILKK